MNLDGYCGATRVVFIVGDPIAQVKSPAGVTALMRERGADAICVPAHVRPQDLPDFVRLAGRLPNVDGILVTVPHKFAVLPLCSSLAPRARSIEAVNMMRHEAAGYTRRGDTQIYISRGLGEGIPLRFMAHPQVTLITVKG